MDSVIYLDYQSTTPIDARVLEAMLPYFGVEYGNAHSTHHSFGWRAHQAAEAAREAIANSIGATREEVIFTSGATESINIALQGLIVPKLSIGCHVISVSTEHKCSLAALDTLRQQGCDVTVLDVSSDGLISAKAVLDAIKPNTALVSVMWVNNEIGVVQPIREIARGCERVGVAFHTDAAQALGKVAIDVTRDGIDLASFSAHKTYGPKGIGALYCKKALQAALHPLIAGGGQEHGIRGGTLPVPLAVGFGEAVALAASERVRETKRLAALSARFLELVTDALPDVLVHGSLKHRIPGNLNLGFPGIESESLLAMCPGVAVSTGSACNSASPEPSHVLRAIGVDYDLANGSIRIGFGRQTTQEEVERAVALIVAAVVTYRAAA